MLLVRNVTVKGCTVSVERCDHLELFRKYVSRNGAERGKAVLECLWLEEATIQLCFSSHPNNVEEAVQRGLKEWAGGQGKRPPTWEVLLQAMKDSNIAVQPINRLKAKLLEQPGRLWELFMCLDLCVCMHVCVCVCVCVCV